MSEKAARTTISLTPDLMEKAQEKQAKDYFQTFSGYISELIKNDIAKAKKKGGRK